MTIQELRSDLLERVRRLARVERPDHPWLELNDTEFLKSARLLQRNYETGEEGLTLAAVLLLGRDEVIQGIVPHYRTDALLRVDQLDRYDDRDDVRTNLIESYDRLMRFVAKHLPDRFHLVGDQRTSLRDRIFREVIANLLIHREYLNGFPAKLVIEKDRVFCENANRPHGHGLIDPATFSPYPKNPTIARFFREIGQADELGSGVRSLHWLCVEYAGGQPQLIEGDIFRTYIPLSIETAPAPAQDELVASGSETVLSRSETVLSRSETVPSRPEAEAIRAETRVRVQEAMAKLGYARSDVIAQIQALVLAVFEAPGLRAPHYAAMINAGLSTTKRYLADLKKAEIVTFMGSTRLGGYYLTEKAQAAIHHD